MLSKNRIFYLCLLLFIIGGGIYLLTNEKGALSLWLNTWHGFFADKIFRYATWIGDGITITALILLLLFIQYRLAIFTAIISVVSSLIISLIKSIINEPRPVEYFKDTKLNFVDGVALFHHLSFPSGHTAAAFAFFCTLGFFVKKQGYQFLFFLVALLVAVSRVYLFQHFFIDVYAGAIIGTINASWIYLLLSRIKWFQKAWASGALLKSKQNQLA